MIQVENLSYGFPDKELYHDISFRLEAGRHCALIGSNGSGKSTLVDMLMRPDQYWFDGRITRDENCRVGYAGQFGWKYGIAAVWAGIGNAILGSLLAWWVLGPRTREMTHRLGATTMPEFFGKRFQSKGLRIASAAIIFVFLIPYTASVYNGLSRLFGMAFGLPYEWCVVGMAVVTCVYVVLGGYMATVLNDFIQGIVMLVGIVAVIAVVLAGQGGFSEAIVSV